MFALDHQKTTLSNLNYRNEKHGTEMVPAIDLTCSVDVSSVKLNDIKPGLREMLYRQPRSGDQLRLVDANDANAFTELRHPDIEPICIKGEFTGYELSIAVNSEEDEEKLPVWTPLAFLVDVTVKGLKVEGREGGTAAIHFKASVSGIDLDAELSVFAKAVNKRQAVLLLVPPSAQADDGANDETTGSNANDDDAQTDLDHAA